VQSTNATIPRIQLYILIPHQNQNQNHHHSQSLQPSSLNRTILSHQNHHYYSPEPLLLLIKTIITHNITHQHCPFIIPLLRRCQFDHLRLHALLLNNTIFITNIPSLTDIESIEYSLALTIRVPISARLPAVRITNRVLPVTARHFLSQAFLVYRCNLWISLDLVCGMCYGATTPPEVMCSFEDVFEATKVSILHLLPTVRRTVPYSQS
jgi:hypothetical protein